MNNSIALLIISCDKYHELWTPLIKTYDLYWNNCDLDKYLLSNNRIFENSSIQTIAVGEDVTWSSNLIKALQILKKKYTHVFLSFDDLFLKSKVDNLKFNLVTDSFLKIDGNCLKYIVGPKHTQYYNSFFGEISAGSLYRPTCVFSLWKIEILLKILDVSENAWQFERNGSGRSDQYDSFYVIYKDIFFYRNVVIQGLINPSDASRFNLSNCQELRVMNKFDFLKFKSRYFIFKLSTLLIPWKLQKSAFRIKQLIFK